MNEQLWEELELTTAILERLRRELTRCQRATAYKTELQSQIDDLSKRREQLLADLRRAASAVS